MAEPTRRSPDEVRARLESGGDALLVCAYADEAKFRGARLEGAISMGTLNAKLPSLSKNAEIIFYWGWPNDASAAGRAAEYREKGYVNANVLAGGIATWRAAGYPVHSEG